MHISRFQLNEYKCFHRSEEIRLEPGINIIVGQNNVGKSAFLEALSLRFTSQPYKSSRITRSPRADANLGSWANLSLTLSKDELFTHLPRLNQTVCVPIPPTPKLPESEKPGLEELRRLVEQQLFAQEFLAIDVQARFENNSLTICHQSAMQPDGQKYSRYPAIHYFDGDGSKQNREFLNCNFDLGGKFEAEIHQPAGEEPLDFGLHLARYLKERVYTFRAERMDIHKCMMVYDKELRPNAINLPALLLQLHPGLLDKLNEYLRLIFPQIHRAFAKMIGGAQQEVEIFVTQFETTEEEDIVSLGSSGTGLSQVLAILYLVICAKEPSVLIIDEPQSFLHPGAARKLIEILSTYPQQHQYIIATHSPALIAAAEPATVALITKEKGEPSKLTSLDGRSLEQLNLCLAEVGARLSDVFGYDRVLWVEGETERECFPLILRSPTQHKLYGTAIVPVHNPSDLVGERSDPRRVLGIYKRLCEGKGLLPPAIGFVFDREGRTNEQIEELLASFAEMGIERQRVQFLLRRMYENYLLDSRAIASVLDAFGKTVEESAITAKLESALSNTAFEEWKRGQPLDKAAQEEWRKVKPKDYFRGLSSRTPRNTNTIHAADVLSDLFVQFELSYRKIETGRMLTRWLLQNKHDVLSEIRVLLDKLFSELPRS